MRIIKENEKFRLICEDYYKTLKKGKDISDKEWNNLKDDELIIYKRSLKKNEVPEITKNAGNYVRLAIADGGELYYWNGEVLHGSVGHALREFWLLNLVWKKGLVVADISTSSNASESAVIKYIKTDEDFIEGLKKIKSSFPIDRLRFPSGNVIKI